MFKFEQTLSHNIFVILGIKIKISKKLNLKYLTLHFIDFLPVSIKIKCILKSKLDSNYIAHYMRNFHKYSYDEIFQLFDTKNSYPKNILSIEKTIDYILENKCSVARIGDGEEFGNILQGIENPNPTQLSIKLTNILANGSNDNCLVCINNFNVDSHEIPNFYRHAFTYYYTFGLTAKELCKIKFSNNKNYGDAYGFLFFFKDTDSNNEMLKKKAKIQQIWDNKKVLFVINQDSDILNDKTEFNNVKEKAYIFGPHANSFEKYEEIKKDILENYDTEWLIYLEMGATATVLAYELAELGYQALDMGAYYERICNGKLGFSKLFADY